MVIRLAIRGFAAGKIQFEDRIEVPMSELEEIIPALALKHAEAMCEHRLHMIEIEFVDEPDPNQKFFRFGTSPEGMVIPIEIDLRGN